MSATDSMKLASLGITVSIPSPGKFIANQCLRDVEAVAAAAVATRPQ
jgi:hypothetical protein